MEKRCLGLLCCIALDFCRSNSIHVFVCGCMCRVEPLFRTDTLGTGKDVRNREVFSCRVKMYTILMFGRVQVVLTRVVSYQCLYRDVISVPTTASKPEAVFLSY